jgi:hypothetical protein
MERKLGLQCWAVLPNVIQCRWWQYSCMFAASALGGVQQEERVTSQDSHWLGVRHARSAPPLKAAVRRDLGIDSPRSQ